MEKQYYMIRFEASKCMFEVRINDIPVITLDLEGQASSTVPINFAILNSGKQSVTAVVLPHSGNTHIDPNAKLSFEIKLFDASASLSFKEQVISYNFPKIDPHKELPILKHNTDFSANVPYTLKGWQDGVLLKDIEDMNIKLRKAYDRIASMINRGSYDEFRKTIANREHIMITSMYIDPVQAEGRISGIIADFNDGFKIMPIPSDAVLQLYGNGKVGALKKINGESALFLVNESSQEELMLDLTFYIPNGKTEFEVI